MIGKDNIDKRNSTKKLKGNTVMTSVWIEVIDQIN